MTSTLKINAPDHSIKSVTIFKSSKAEIVRRFPLELKAGQNKVEIRGLPSTIDTDSVRVSGLGDARLFDVVCTIGANKDASFAHDSPAEAVRLLRVKKQALESEKRVRDHEADLLVSYAKTLTGEHVSPTQMSGFLESFVEQGRKNLQAITEVGEKIIEVDRQISKQTEKDVSKKGEAHGEVTIILGADDASSVDLSLTYIVSNVFWKPTYELHATTENGKPSPAVSLHYRARVIQSTGEDWAGTALTLSTMSSDTVAKKIPQLVPVKLRPRPVFPPRGGGGVFGGRNDFAGRQAGQQQSSLFAQPVQSVNQQQQQPQQQNTFGGGGGVFGTAPPAPALSSIFGSYAPAAATSVNARLFGSSAPAASAPAPAPSFGSFGLFGPAPAAATPPHGEEEAYEEVSAPESITEPTTFVHETPVAISFSITGASTIPSDGIEHQVSVAVLPFEAAISYVAIPRVEPRVYLQCQVKNTSEYRLLAGLVSVILDDSYVSKTSINDVSTGDTFSCTLGDDIAAKVTYSRTSRTSRSEGGSFTEAHHTVTYTTTITIHNKHGFGLEGVVVREAVPTCDDNRAKVVLRKPEGLADAKDWEAVVVGKKGNGVEVLWEKEKEGRFEWRAGVGAQDKVVLEAVWEVKAPADMHWVEERTYVPPAL